MHGKNRIGFSLIETNNGSAQAYSPLTGETLPEEFSIAGDSEVDQALTKAESAFETYKSVSGVKKAEFLEAIADEIISLGDELIQRASSESALPEGRITGERGRTVGQLKLFASLLREGSWVDASIEPAMPERQPLPRVDIRKMSVPVGPVVVFTASNFPLAFSTAGGDTASALAAGNPVVVKAHESHLGTNELIADAIARAAQKTGMPDGVFSTLTGKGFELGQALVQHPKTKSVAFTGSFRGGKALYDLASQREEPIPVFAEMGSVNPVFLLPDKLSKETSALAKAYAGSITMGVGQFCTNPGVIIGITSDALTQFREEIAAEFKQKQAEIMLNPGISKAYTSGTETALQQTGVTTLAQGMSQTEKAQATVAGVSGNDFLKNPKLLHEVFGPFSLIVTCENAAELHKVVLALPGQLTTTFMATDQDISDYTQSIKKATEICGRLIFNGVPTGVEVCYGMQHGGPFPASTDGRFTSVGADAIKRFVRPVSFQDAPQSILPSELRDDNPLNIWRKINGELTKNTV